MNAPYEKNGFTLVELAISLMVIGLLIGGVLKGQELIKNAEITKILRQHNEYKAAVAIFQSTYNGLPGDFNHPNRLTNCTTAPCSNIGNGNGKIDNFVNVFPDTPYYEVHLCAGESPVFWHHLWAAGLVTNTGYDGSCRVTAAVDSFPSMIVVGYDTSNVGSPLADAPENFVVFMPYRHFPQNDGVDTRVMQRLDEKGDDGKPTSGSIRAMGGYNYNAGNNISPNCADVASNTYAVEMTNRACNLGMSLSN